MLGTMLLEFSQRIVKWQSIHGRNNLPWSQSQGLSIADFAYRVWVSEIMLQQTQVNTVIAYFNQFQKRFPKLLDLAQAELNEVLTLWAGLGYYSRARYLHRTAQIIAQQYNGIIPNEFQALVDLPGIGASTAGAILSLGYQKRAAILDGNVKRVLARHAGVLGWVGSSKVSKQLWSVADAYLISPTIQVTPNHHRRYTQGLMDLGATVCHKIQPNCTHCPVSENCFAYTQGMQDQFPQARPKRILPIQTRSALILYDCDGIWLLKRELNGLWGGLLSFLEADNDAYLHKQALDWIQLAHIDTIPQITSWKIPYLKHNFTHYQLHWTLWGMYINPSQSMALKLNLPQSWSYITWSNIALNRVPTAVLKALGIHQLKKHKSNNESIP